MSSSLIKSQFGSKALIEKAYLNFKKSPKDRLAKEVYIQTRLVTLEEQWKIVSQTHRKLCEDVDSIIDTDYYKKDIYEDIQDIYVMYKSDLKDALNLLPINNSSSQGVDSKVGCNIKLPKISIPIFSGVYSEWTTFKDLYLSLIHNNNSLDNVQKMHYLKGHLSGEAEQLLRHISVTTANYESAWLTLNSRYNNKKFLVNSLLQRFINQPSISTESCKALKDLLDVTNDTLNGLRGLGISVDSWDVIIIYIICLKLDAESRKQWETKISDVEQLPTLNQMYQFLESRFRSLEFLDVKPKYRSNVSTNKPKALHVTTNSCCILCNNGDHKLGNCKEFVKMSYKTRHNFAQTNAICFNCLGRNHSAKVCRSNNTCRICKHKHHSLLHPIPNTSPDPCGNDLQPLLPVDVNKQILSNSKAEAYCPQSATSVATHFSKQSTPKQILLATALVQAKARNGYAHLLRALIDQGSQASFVTESVVQQLGLRKIPNKSIISGLGGDKSQLASRYIVMMNIQSRHDQSFQVTVRAHVISAITSLLPSEKVPNFHWPNLVDLQLADPEFKTPNKIDVLFGADVYGDIIREGLIKGPKGLPTAQKTALGWILSGPIHNSVDDRTSTNCNHSIVVSMHSHYEDDANLKKFWQLENDSFDTKILTEEESYCEDFYEKTTRRDDTGRYIVRLPFREENPQCKYGNLRDIAIKRFHHLENQYKKNDQMKVRYAEVMHEYLTLGHMEPIAPDHNRSESVYLPHHAVIRNDKTTTKVRVVFDASCKGINGVSLNDTLMVGPTLQDDLRHIIMRWRMHPICLSADIVKMYRQIRVNTEDADFQRLVWRDDPESEIKEYKLMRVTFGTACAPYLAVKTLQQLACDEGKAYPNISEKIKKDFYVDDLLTGCQTVEEGKVIYKDIKKLLSKGGFELQKWISNNKELTAILAEGKENKREGLDIKMDEIVKILGISWNRDSDSFNYSTRFPSQTEPFTKRRVISDISRLFDPLGWVAPCIVLAKMMIQKLWLAGIGWDDELPDELLSEWITYRENLSNLDCISIPRWVVAKIDDVSQELHGFSDASNAAYAAVVYLRIIKNSGEVHVNLITAKTKVAPTMQVSIPRLELMGAVLLAKLLSEVATSLSIDRSKIYGWTDSTVVLSWLSSHPSRWSTFIGNRTSEILSRLDNTQWSHVSSDQNPADIASRGCYPTDLANNNIWFHGPLWLKMYNIHFNRPKLPTIDLERRKLKTHTVTSTDDNGILEIWRRFSSLTRLTRVIAYCRRFLKLNKTRNKPYFEQYLNSSEISEALSTCIRQCQAKELNKLNIRSLNPFKDNDGIWRVGGRLGNANQLSDDTRNPIILPHRSHLTDLIVADAHKKTMHGGPTLMLHYLRTKYWIISAKSLVKSYVKKCVTCVRYAATTTSQIMGQLPPSRITPAKPFLRSGVDFAGPINIRMSKGRGNKSYKGYICLFVCMVTKAIHLEAVGDLSSEGFIAGFKRFVARRGLVSDIWSDNGTNFVGASKELQRLVVDEKSSVALEIREWLNSNFVTWHFIPPRAPHFGGLWEAGVKSTKFHLRRVVGDSTLTFEELTTVLTQIEACLNSRPLSVLPNDHIDPLPLTPGHFLIGEPLLVVPERNYEQSNISSLKRWQITQRMLQDFWRRWSNEYLVYCLQRYKWSNLNPEPKINDIVLVKEDNLPPAHWLLGRVVEKHPGLDGITRVVTLRCKESLIKRPIVKLCVLPVTE